MRKLSENLLAIVNRLTLDIKGIVTTAAKESVMAFATFQIIITAIADEGIVALHAARNFQVPVFNRCLLYRITNARYGRGYEADKLVEVVQLITYIDLSLQILDAIN